MDAAVEEGIESSDDETTPLARLHADETSLRLARAYSQNPKPFEKDFRRPAQRARARFLARIGRGLRGQDAADLLSEYLVEIESSLASLIGKHSVYYWLHLSRRVAPEPINGVSPWTAFLARRILDLAICKYGQPATPELVEDEFELRDGVSHLRETGYFEAVDVYSAEYLAYEYWYATARYRVVNKGGALRQDGREYHTETSDDTRQLIGRKDARSGRSSLYSALGSADFARSFDTGTLLLPRLNVERDEYPIDSFFKLNGLGDESPFGRFNPNYMPQRFELAEMLEALAPFEQYVVDHTGLAPRDLALALEALLLRVAWRLVRSSEYDYEFLQRGWLMYSDPIDLFCRDAAALFAAAGHDDVDEATVAGALETLLLRFMLDDDQRSEIDLWSRRPASLVIPVADGFLLDLSAVLHVVIESAHAIGTQDGVPGDTKGKVFERQVVAYLAEIGVDFWECTRELVAPSGDIREIDVSFVVRDQLYVVECKAFAHTNRLDNGDYWPTARRWELLVAAHNQAETLIAFLERNRTGSNYRVPDEVAGYVPIVCTPHDEWVPSSAAPYWLTSQIPVFCTPSELREYLSALV